MANADQIKARTEATEKATNRAFTRSRCRSPRRPRVAGTASLPRNFVNSWTRPRHELSEPNPPGARHRP